MAYLKIMSGSPQTDFIEIVRKVERLSSAVFLVSDTMSEGEELKTTTRNLSLELIAKASSLNNGSVGERIKQLYTIQSLVLNLSSIFQVAAVSGLVSAMNASIIRENIDSFLMFLQGYSLRLEGSTQTSMADKFLDLKSPLDSLAVTPEPAAGVHIGQDIGPVNKVVKTTRKDARGKTILDFIKTKESVNIKDIVRNVKGCSEKTIQRELLKMVEGGIIRKTGERRWSRYSYLPSGQAGNR